MEAAVARRAYEVVEREMATPLLVDLAVLGKEEML